MAEKNSTSTPAMLGLHHVALQTPHYEEARSFYIEVMGFEVEWEPDSDNVYLTSGSDNLAIHRTAAIPDPNQNLDHIGILVATPEDVDSWYEHFNAKRIFVSEPPRTHRDGARSLYCLDPAGNKIQVIYHPPISDSLTKLKLLEWS